MKFHVDNNGVVSKCKAVKGKCPFASEEQHIDAVSLEEANFKNSKKLENDYSDTFKSIVDNNLDLDRFGGDPLFPLRNGSLTSKQFASLANRTDTVSRSSEYYSALIKHKEFKEYMSETLPQLINQENFEKQLKNPDGMSIGQIASVLHSDLKEKAILIKALEGNRVLDSIIDSQDPKMNHLIVLHIGNNLLKNQIDDILKSEKSHSAHYELAKVVTNDSQQFSLLNHSSSPIPLAAGENPNLTDKNKKWIMTSGSSENKMGYAYNENAKPEDLKILLKSNDARIRFRAAGNPNTPLIDVKNALKVEVDRDVHYAMRRRIKEGK